MGKNIVQTTNQGQEVLNTIQNGEVERTNTSFYISDKSYVQFFLFLKDLHASQGQAKSTQPQSSSSLENITTSIMNFFNYEKTYSNKQLGCSIICLSNLFNVIGNTIAKLRFENEFVSKIRRFLSDLVQDGEQLGIQQKIQAILYILAVLIYKQRIGQQKTIRDVTRSIFSDRAIVNFLLELVLPVQKKIAKFYGIFIIYLAGKKLNNRLKKKAVKSILLNFCKIDHQPTLLNLLVYLRSEKNKVTINFKDVKEGRILQLLLNAYPKHIHQYQSFYILDYAYHLLSLFPSLAVDIANSSFLPFLLINSGPGNLHHPLHSSTIIQFVQKTLRYLQPGLQHKLLEEVVMIEHSNHSITIKLAEILVNLWQNNPNILKFAFNGYFNRLLGIICQQPEESIKIRGIQLYLAIIERTRPFNQAVSELLTHRIRTALQNSREENKLKFISYIDSKINKPYQWA